MKFLAKTIFGLEELLAKEIESFGGKNCNILNRAVSFQGDLDVLYRINYWSRLALRVLHPILKFKAHNETVLYKRLRRFDWTNLIRLDHTFKINCVVHSSRFTHSKYIALKTKDAIVDLFRLKLNNQRPSISIDNPDVVIDVHCYENEFTISLDSSGESLHRRGYRLSNRPAPLNEVLAAGMILMSGWDRKSVLFDPMCGSGTILMEAFSIALNLPPRPERERYALMKWRGFNRKKWNECKSFMSEEKVLPGFKLYGFDKNERLLSETKRQIRQIGFDQFVELQRKDFLINDPPCLEGMIIMNPPYGKRIQEDQIEQFYGNIGDALKQKYNGWQAWILSGNKEAIKSVGLRTSKKRTLYNGPIECKYHLYELYRGSKRTTKDNS